MSAKGNKDSVLAESRCLKTPLNQCFADLGWKDDRNGGEVNHPLTNDYDSTGSTDKHTFFVLTPTRKRRKRKVQQPDSVIKKKRSVKNRTVTESQKHRAICKFFREGYCRDGGSCTFSHDAADSDRKAELCRYYGQGYCMRGVQCNFLHGEYPCKAFFQGHCTKNPCRFSHMPLTTYTQPIFDQMLKADELKHKISVREVPVKHRVLLPAGPNQLPTVRQEIVIDCKQQNIRLLEPHLSTTAVNKKPVPLLPPKSGVRFQNPTASFNRTTVPPLSLLKPPIVPPNPLFSPPRHVLCTVPSSPSPQLNAPQFFIPTGVTGAPPRVSAFFSPPPPPPQLPPPKYDQSQSSESDPTKERTLCQPPSVTLTAKAEETDHEDEGSDSPFDVDKMLEQLVSEARVKSVHIDEPPASPSVPPEEEVAGNMVMTDGKTAKWRLIPLHRIPTPYSYMDASVFEATVSDPRLSLDPRIGKALQLLNSCVDHIMPNQFVSASSCRYSPPIPSICGELKKRN